LIQGRHILPWSLPIFLDDMWQIIDDLRKVRSLDPEVMFPAPTHIVKSPVEKLDNLIVYLEELGGKIVKLYQTGMTADRIRDQIFGAENIIAEATQQQFSSLNMVKSFLRKYAD